MKIHIGLSDQQRKEISTGLCHLLADTYMLYLKTHGFHWNVTGPNFAALHLMFEGQYQELFQAVDRIAERIRALGEIAPGSYVQFSKLTAIEEETGVPSSEEMIKQLVLGQEVLVKTARKLLPLVEGSDDQPTLDLLTDRMEIHEKNAWMLRSCLE